MPWTLLDTSWYTFYKQRSGFMILAWWYTTFGFIFLPLMPPGLYLQHISNRAGLHSSLPTQSGLDKAEGSDAHPHSWEQIVNSIVSSKVCGDESPSKPFSHKTSSSSGVSGSACLLWAPLPLLCSLFISASSDALNWLNSLSAKKSTVGCPFNLRYHRLVDTLCHLVSSPIDIELLLIESRWPYMHAIIITPTEMLSNAPIIIFYL